MSASAEDMTLEEMRTSRSYFVRLAQERNDEIDLLRARVAELESAIRAVQWEHAKVVTAHGTWCRICSPQDGSWPCVARMELDAVLPLPKARSVSCFVRFPPRHRYCRLPYCSCSCHAGKRR